LTPEQSDRLVRVARVLAAAEETFGNREKAGTWLRRPTTALAGERPLELLDTANLSQAPRPGCRLVAVAFVAPCPVGHDFDGQRSLMAKIVDMTSEALYRVARTAQGKSQPAALTQIIVGVQLHGGQRRIHAAHPGQGNATSARFLLSSLA
jgi:hypothetical protein